MKYKNQTFDELSEIIQPSNFEDCVFNASIDFEKCNLRNCQINYPCNFDKSNIIDCTGFGLKFSKFKKSNQYNTKEEKHKREK